MPAAVHVTAAFHACRAAQTPPNAASAIWSAEFWTHMVKHSADLLMLDCSGYPLPHQNKAVAKRSSPCCLPAGVEYGSRNVLADPELREGVKQYSDWPTIPQVYVNGEFVGGSDILMNMHESGDLKKMFLDKQ